MLYRNLLGALALSALCAQPAGAQIVDFAKYPDLKGQWNRVVVRGLPGQPSFDQTKPWGLGQEAPLTPEARAILEASMADQAAGGRRAAGLRRRAGSIIFMPRIDCRPSSRSSRPVPKPGRNSD